MSILSAVDLRDLSALVSIVAILFTVGTTYGILKTVIKNLDKRVEALESQKANELKIVLESTIARVKMLEDSNNLQNQLLHEMDKKLTAIQTTLSQHA